MFVTISGPSGSGKSTLITSLEQQIGAKLLPSWTTRAPRAITAPDTTYNYISTTDYLSLRASGELIIDENIALNNYGTKKDDLSFALEDSNVIWIADLAAKAVLSLLDKGLIPTLCIVMHVTKCDSQFRMEQRGDHPIDICNRIDRYEEELNNCKLIQASNNNVAWIDGQNPPDFIFKSVVKILHNYTLLHD